MPSLLGEKAAAEVEAENDGGVAGGRPTGGEGGGGAGRGGGVSAGRGGGAGGGGVACTGVVRLEPDAPADAGGPR